MHHQLIILYIKRILQHSFNSSYDTEYGLFDKAEPIFEGGLLIVLVVVVGFGKSERLLDLIRFSDEDFDTELETGV